MKFIILLVIAILVTGSAIAMTSKEVEQSIKTPPDHHVKAYKNVLLFKQYGILIPLTPDQDPNAPIGVWKLQDLRNATNVTAFNNETHKVITTTKFLNGTIVKNESYENVSEIVPAMMFVPGTSITRKLYGDVFKYYAIVKISGMNNDSVVEWDPAWRHDPIILCAYSKE